MYPRIKGLLKNTFLDWEGKIATIIFLQGCNWQCHYCHSPHLINMDADESIPEEEVFKYIEENREWVDGIVICGGEPTVYSQFPQFLAKFQEQGVPIKLDTNGSQPAMLEQILNRGLVDFIAMDIKTSLKREKYEVLTEASVDPEVIRNSIDIIMSKAKDYEFRTTLCPLYVNEGDIRSIAREINGAKRYALQQFEPDNCLDDKMMDIAPYPRKTIEHFQSIAEHYVKECSLRGNLDSAGLMMTA